MRHRFAIIARSDLIKSFLIYGLASACSKFISVLLLPIYTAIFSVEEYGEIDLIQSVILIITIFGILQLETSLQRFYYEFQNEERKKMVSTILWSVTFISALLVALFSLFSKQISILLFQTDRFGPLLILSSLLILFTNVTTIFFIIIRYMKKPFLFAVLMLIQILVSIGSTLLLVLCFHKGISGVFTGQLLGFGTVLLLQLFLLKNEYTWSINGPLLKSAFSFALPQFPARLGSVCNAYMNRFFMLGYLSTFAIGIYSVSLKFASIMALIDSAFIMAWYPFMYDNLKSPQHKILFGKIFKYACLSVFSIVTIIGFFADDIIKLFIKNPEYYEASKLIGWLTLYQSLFILKNIVDIGPIITKKTVYITYTYLIAAVCNIIFLYIAMHLGGLQEMVVAMVLTNIILISTAWYFSYRLYPVPYNTGLFIGSLLTCCFLLTIFHYIELSFLQKTFILLIMSALGWFTREKWQHALSSD